MPAGTLAAIRKFRSTPESSSVTTAPPAACSSPTVSPSESVYAVTRVCVAVVRNRNQSLSPTSSSRPRAADPAAISVAAPRVSPWSSPPARPEDPSPGGPSGPSAGVTTKWTGISMPVGVPPVGGSPSRTVRIFSLPAYASAAKAAPFAVTAISTAPSALVHSGGTASSQCWSETIR